MYIYIYIYAWFYNYMIIYIRTYSYPKQPPKTVTINDTDKHWYSWILYICVAEMAPCWANLPGPRTSCQASAHWAGSNNGGCGGGASWGNCCESLRRSFVSGHMAEKTQKWSFDHQKDWIYLGQHGISFRWGSISSHFDWRNRFCRVHVTFQPFWCCWDVYILNFNLGKIYFFMKGV